MQRRQVVLSLPAFMAAGVAGAQANVVRFGLSASLTGGQAQYGKDIQQGITAAFASAARAETGRPLRFELITLDDGGDKKRCAANARSLIDSGVTALLGFTSGAGAEAAMPIIEEAQVPLLGVASGNMGIRSKKMSMAYHVRAGYDDEYKRMVSYVQQFGMKRVGYVFLEDTTAANQTAMAHALEQVGGKFTEVVPLSRNAKTFQDEANKLLRAKLDCILFTTNAAPILSIIDLMSAARYPGMYFASSFAGQTLIDETKQRGVSVILTSVLPRPNAVALPLVKRATEDVAALGGGAHLGYTNLEGYVVGQVAIEAARQAGKAPGALTRTRFREALSSVHVDLGGYKVAFTPGNPQGSRYVEVVAVDRAGRIIG